MKTEEVKKMPKVKVQGWNIKEIAEQSASKEPDEILKEVLASRQVEPDSEIPEIEAFEENTKAEDGKLND